MRPEDLAAENETGSWPFDNTYARLPDRFYASQAPVPVESPHLLRLNVPLAEHLGLDPEHLRTADGVAVLAGNRVPDGASPLAMAYAGHQFGNLVPQLGDGRAILLGEVVDRDGVRRDIQLKGAGRTPFSRMGDGRAAIGPVLREYIVSEGMAALGVQTTRALAAVATGEPVLREQVLPGAVLTRIARSHLRVGTLEYFAVRGDVDAVRTLVRYALARHDPDAAPADDAEAARTLIDRVAARQADLVAQWMALGFIHGVMNTDNMSLAGETIDYGPCAFMDAFHPGTVYSSIDQGGRYAYGNQPRIAGWNLARLAETLLPLLAEDKDAAIAAAQEAIDAFPPLFDRAYRTRMFAKIGLATEEEGDGTLLEDLLQRMADNGADFTLTFRRLARLSGTDASGDGPVRDLFADPAAFDAWAARWRERLEREPRGEADRQAAMRAVNPARIPRNHLVEEAIAAAQAGDLSAFHQLVEILAAPFEDLPDDSAYLQPPRPDQVVRQTFCGT